MRPGWQKKLLGDICESKLGKTLNASTDQGEVRPYLCAVNVKWDTFDLATIKTAPFDADEIKKYSVRKGDLLVCEGGETGRAAIWDREEPIQYQNALHRIRFKEGTILPRFCLHYLRFLKLSGVLDKEYSHGATILHLVTNSLYSIPIEYPSLPEQQRIVDILDQEFTKIDALKVNAEKSLQAAKDLFQATLKKELEPKEGWKRYCLQDVCTDYGDYGMSLPSKSFDGVRYLRITDITEWGDLNDDKVSVDADVIDERYMVRAGDILFARTGATVGKTLVYEERFGRCCYAGYLIRYRPDQSIVLPRMLYYITHSAPYYEWVATSQKSATLPNISAKLYNSYELCLPPTKEQDQIISHLDDLNEKCIVLQKNYQKTLALCDDLKQAILRKAFNGEL